MSLDERDASLTLVDREERVDTAVELRYSGLEIGDVLQAQADQQIPPRAARV